MVSSAGRKWWALALLSVVQFMVVLDIAIVNVALPSIQVDLGFSQENLQWVISAYALVLGGFLLLGGRAADLLGRRRVFLVGLAVFTLGSLFAGLAWSEASLISARALQGLGAAVISPAALSMLTTTFTEGRERNIALGVWGAVGGFGAAAGVLLGGVFTQLLSWEWIFFINIPVGITAAIVTPRLLAESHDRTAKSFDALGAALVTSGLSTAVFGITKANDYGWGSARALGIFAAAVALLAGFLVRETRASDPLMSFSIFRIKTVTGANVAGFILGTALFSMFLMLTLYMQQVLGYSALKTGVAYLALVAARDEGRCQAGARDRDDAADRRAPVLHAGLRRRLVPRRPAARLPDRRDGDGVLVRADLDRGPGRRRGEGRRPRIRADQHVAADRRRARDRGALLGRGLAHARRRAVGGADERLPRGLLGRRRGRRGRGRRRRDPRAARRARAGAAVRRAALRRLDG
jgi:MFS family permease